MKTSKTDDFIKEGILMKKVLRKGSWGLFYSSPTTYESKTVYDMKDALKLQDDGWFFNNQDYIFHNIALMLYKDIKLDGKRNSK